MSSVLIIADGLETLITDCQWRRYSARPIIIDEAWFHLSGYVDSQTATNPHKIKDTLHDRNLGVHVFFDGTINSKRYCEVILYPFIGHLNEDKIARSYFQHDGATAHTARVSMTLLLDLFGDRKNFKGHLATTVARSYTPGLLSVENNERCKNNPHTLRELKEAVANSIRHISPIELSRVFANKIRRANGNLQARGGQFEHLL
jgi:hypothetical protein